jgi:hypothetical protein
MDESKQPPAAPQKKPAESKILKWTCPMHPSYISDKPGKCPYCKMDLEPVSAGKEKSPKRK